MNRPAGGRTAVLSRAASALVLAAGCAAGHGAARPPHPQHHTIGSAPPLTVTPVAFTRTERSPTYHITGTYAEVSGMKDAAAQARANASLRSAVDQRIEAYHEDDVGRMPGITMTFTDSVRVLWTGPRYVSVVYTVETSTNRAAHPLVHPVAVDLDLGTGATLTAQDIFRPSVFTADGRNRLARLITHAADQDCVDRPESVPGALDGITGDPAKPGSSLGAAEIGLTPAGLELHFQPYSIASFACTLPIVHLPYAQVTDFLQPSIRGR